MAEVLALGTGRGIHHHTHLGYPMYYLKGTVPSTPAVRRVPVTPAALCAVQKLDYGFGLRV